MKQQISHGSRSLMDRIAKQGPGCAAAKVLAPTRSCCTGTWQAFCMRSTCSNCRAHNKPCQASSDERTRSESICTHQRGLEAFLLVKRAVLGACGRLTCALRHGDERLTIGRTTGCSFHLLPKPCYNQGHQLTTCPCVALRLWPKRNLSKVCSASQCLAPSVLTLQAT